MAASVDDHYATLGVHRGATPNDIKRAYRELALKWHPDRNPSGSTFFKRLVLAYEVLSDDSRRRAFDSQWILRDGVAVSGFNSGASSQQQQQPPRPFSSRPASAPHHAFRADGNTAQRGGEDRRYAKPFATGGFTASTFFPTFGYKAPPVSAATYSASTGGFGSSSSSPSAPTTARPQPSPPRDADSNATRKAADGMSQGASAPTGNSSSAPEHLDNPSAYHDTFDAVAADRAKATTGKRSESVSGYNISEEEQARLRSMRERFDAAQSVDMAAWERIRNRPTSATVRTASSGTTPAAPAPATNSFDAGRNYSTFSASQPFASATADAVPPRPCPQQVRPSSARPFTRNAAPTVPLARPSPPPQAQPSSEPREQPASPIAAAEQQAAPSAAATSPPLSHDAAPAAAMSAPPRPFSAGVARYNRSATTVDAPARSETKHATSVPAAASEGYPRQQAAESPPPDLCAESLFVPSDSEVASMKGKELAYLIARLEKKLKVARQTALIGSFS